MTREDVEKARSNYIKELCEAKKLSNSANIDIACNAFRTGAEWRINSIWHTIDEVPKEDKFILIQKNDGYFQIAYSVKHMKMYFGYLNVARWCYLDDLLPTKDE